MQQDVVELRDFYNRPLGGVVRRLLTSRIRSRWRSAQGAQLMGLGFAVPYIGMFRGEAARLGALMPAGQGAMAWPAEGKGHTVLVEEAMLPLADASVDRLLAVHCLETSERVGPLLREIWRVLAPEGRLLLIVPNRRGIWARLDTTPFGHGRPYSRGPARAAAHRCAVLAAGMDERALHAAHRPAVAGALGHRLRARRRAAVAGLCRRHHRRGEEGADGRHPQGRPGAAGGAAGHRARGGLRRGSAARR